MLDTHLTNSQLTAIHNKLSFFPTLINCSSFRLVAPVVIIVIAAILPTLIFIWVKHCETRVNHPLFSLPFSAAWNVFLREK